MTTASLPACMRRAFSFSSTSQPPRHTLPESSQEWSTAPCSASKHSVRTNLTEHNGQLPSINASWLGDTSHLFWTRSLPKQSQEPNNTKVHPSRRRINVMRSTTTLDIIPATQGHISFNRPGNTMWLHRHLECQWRTSKIQ